MKCHVSSEGDAHKESTVIQKMVHIILCKRKQYAKLCINKTVSILETIKTKDECSDSSSEKSIPKMLSGIVWMINFGSLSPHFYIFLNFSVCTCAVL